MLQQQEAVLALRDAAVKQAEAEKEQLQREMRSLSTTAEEHSNTLQAQGQALGRLRRELEVRKASS